MSYNSLGIYAGSVEFKMPEEMARMYLKGRKGNDLKLRPVDFLVKIVNEEFGLKGRCVNVITY